MFTIRIKTGKNTVTNLSIQTNRQSSLNPAQNEAAAKKIAIDRFQKLNQYRAMSSQICHLAVNPMLVRLRWKRTPWSFVYLS